MMDTSNKPWLHVLSQMNIPKPSLLFLLVAGFAAFSGFDLDRNSVSAREIISKMLSHPQAPPVPTWPDQFNTKFYVYVEEYGSEWNSTGIIYYDWTVKTFRSDYLKWCLPLFDSESTNDNYTCSFLATEGNLYFVNHTSDKWEDMECCLFAEGLAAVPPNWMDNCQYNGTAEIQDVLCDVWWFPGTSDPEKPCYGYWNERGKNTPVQFFGLSSIGPTILEYFDFNPGQNPQDVNIKKPNNDCDKECNPPVIATLMKTVKKHKNSLMWWPEWPSCE